MGNLQIKASSAPYALLSDVSPDSPGSQPPTPKLTRVASPPQALADLPTKGTGKLPQVSAQPSSPKATTGPSRTVSAELPLSSLAPLQLTSLLPPSESGETPEKLGAVPISGNLQIKNGQLTSNNETIRSLIHYLGAAADKFANQANLNGMQVTIRPNPYATAGHEALKEYCSVETALVHADKPPRRKPSKDPLRQPLRQTPPPSHTENIEGNVLMPLLTSVIESGPAAFGTNDRIKLGGQEVPVHALLAALAPRVEVNDPDLQLAFNSKLSANTQANAKLGAATLLQMETHKTFALKELGMSLAVSSGLGTAWELVAAEGIKGGLKHMGLTAKEYILAAAGIDSSSAIGIETSDSAIVLSAVQSMNRATASFLRRVWDALPAAAVAGLKSAVGSYPNNLLQYMSTGSYAADLALNSVTTEVAILAAASGVPGEVKKNEANLQAAIVEKLRDGLLAVPPREPHMSPEQYTEIVEKHVQALTRRALDMSPGDGIAQKSLAFATMVGLIPLILGNKVTNLVAESALRIVRSTIFNPIESIGMNALVLTSKIDIPGLMSSDATKHAQTVGRILQEAALGKPLQDGEVHKIFHQWDGLTLGGRAILNGMSATMDAPPEKVMSMLKKDSSPPLSQRIAYESIDYDRV
ncbi:XopB/HopD1 family type III secretion system effector [Ralstonia nicotianae]|uniref:XopB/HopD1 family type III secretion system effector n=1 Tax=Ralstonia pseudosolanacearum TaxID=1310165 RepID=UPI001F405D17|nr:XopB/HopD1 family type III secretion system effector [Ralstonia pseudosolanacearum]MCF1441247.1 type III effector protein [Ralstonia solanacearum]